MSNVDELIERSLTNEHNDDEQYWEQLIADMQQFLKENHPEKEKRKLRPLGALEMAYMTLSAIQYKKEHNNGKR